ncbi:hypothetical protein DVH24_024153 [Malus domestica]|uniref:Uncharacterized protein n=1 Tax=Malus domestica TaxID=3750 RepID=A0A498JF47_MALDO|nr:hypothetical protein DVH24_024153 [Malus domestica]
MGREVTTWLQHPFGLSFDVRDGATRSPPLFPCPPLCFGSMPFYRRTVDMAVEVSGMQLSWGVEMLRENHLLSGERGSFRGF